MSKQPEKPDEDVCVYCGAWVVNAERHKQWHTDLRLVLDGMNRNGYNPNAAVARDDIRKVGE